MYASRPFLAISQKQTVRVATQYASTPCQLAIFSHSFARWHLFRHIGYLRHQQQVDLWPFDLESGVLVSCDVGDLCANFSLPRPLCSRFTLCTRQTDRRKTSDRQKKASLNASALWGRRHRIERRVTNFANRRWTLGALILSVEWFTSKRSKVKSHGSKLLPVVAYDIIPTLSTFTRWLDHMLLIHIRRLRLLTCLLTYFLSTAVAGHVYSSLWLTA